MEMYIWETPLIGLLGLAVVVLRPVQNVLYTDGEMLSVVLGFD